ncbi:hypothetical protein J132_01727 [Termitomyces sp. J132]|nr:hypothetical protein H2248_000348 [Termitomyces sp. 'cryptogamus']KNZ78202.1 hypothetical protein J132_01727 [Termitomyces sp. J132]
MWRLKQIVEEQHRYQPKAHKRHRDEGNGKSSQKQKHKGDETNDNGWDGPKDERWTSSGQGKDDMDGDQGGNGWGPGWQWMGTRVAMTGRRTAATILGVTMVVTIRAITVGMAGTVVGILGVKVGGDAPDNNGGDGWNNGSGDGWNNAGGDGWDNTGEDVWGKGGGNKMDKS